MQKIFALSQIQSIMVESETVTGAAAVLQVAELRRRCVFREPGDDGDALVGAFESVPKIKPILTLHETVPLVRRWIRTREKRIEYNHSWRNVTSSWSGFNECFFGKSSQCSSIGLVYCKHSW